MLLNVQIHQEIGRFPLIIRPAFTLGGTGGGIAYNMDEFREIVDSGLTASLTKQASQYIKTGHCPVGHVFTSSAETVSGYQRLDAQA